MLILVYLCAILLVVVIALLVYYIINTRRNAHPHKLSRATDRYDTLLATCVASGDYCLPKRDIRCLGQTVNLEAFYRACKKLSPDERRRVLLDNQRPIIDVQLREKNTTIHAYFAYLMHDLGPFSGNEGGYGDLMTRFLDDNSIYTRENALKAMYSFGNANLVADALVSLSHRGVSHNQKLVADGLLTFHGDDALLAERLMGQYDELLECYRNALIDYLNRKGVDIYDNRLMQEARGANVSLDTTCAIIRKISKSPSEQNLQFLKEMVDRYQDGDDWEPVAIAATGLAHYNRSATAKDLLKNMVTSPNWYVRKNAAIALVQVGLTKEDIDEIHAKNDRYATNAIDYELGRCAYA